ncbi:MAG TPA: OmpA family protein [Candidatus Methanoperedens sp.]|nr:OmpA family protein [Candidatus Methanoperedens sp.]
MKLFRMVLASVLASIVAVAPVPARAEDEEEGPKFEDTAYFTGMSNYAIYEAEDKDFDSWSFLGAKGCTAVEGRKFHRAYAPKEGTKPASELQIARNYANAIKERGGTILFDGQADNSCAENTGYRMVVGKFVKGGDELWAEIVPWGDGSNYSIVVVVKEAMKQEVTASDLFEALNRDGRVALYINFDTGKATIRPDSQQVIDQVAQMLSSNPSLTLGVEGHTDSVGTPAANKTLSESRAKAVVAALAAKGIDAKRLTPAGWGQEKPVADNGTEEGRARNRRVDLVRK